VATKLEPLERRIERMAVFLKALELNDFGDAARSEKLLWIDCIFQYKFI
jgi:hypothetical protein